MRTKWTIPQITGLGAAYNNNISASSFSNVASGGRNSPLYSGNPNVSLQSGCGQGWYTFVPNKNETFFAMMDRLGAFCRQQPDPSGQGLGPTVKRNANGGYCWRCITTF